MVHTRDYDQSSSNKDRLTLKNTHKILTSNLLNEFKRLTFLCFYASEEVSLFIILFQTQRKFKFIRTLTLNDAEYNV